MFMTFKMKFLNAPKLAQGHRNYIPKDITNPRAGAEQSSLAQGMNSTRMTKNTVAIEDIARLFCKLWPVAY